MTNQRSKMAVAGLLAMVSFLAGVSCAPVTVPSPVAQSQPATVASPSAALKTTWESEWDKVQQEARREGALTIYSGMGPAIRDALVKVFRERFGVNLDVVIGSSSEITVKLTREGLAGLYHVDVWMVGKTGVEQLANEGIIGRIDDQIFLPEALDEKAWWQGELPWMDQGHRYHLALLASPQPPISVNTEMVQANEIASYSDLLNPKWKGKIVILDPSGSGAGNAWFTTVAVVFMDLDYLRKLATQEPVIVKESGLGIETVARGKYPIGLGMSGEPFTHILGRWTQYIL